MIKVKENSTKTHLTKQQLKNKTCQKNIHQNNMILDHSIKIGFLICKRSSIDAFIGDNMLDHLINHTLVILVILIVKFNIVVSYAFHPLFN
jgi:hypothetical protein